MRSFRLPTIWFSAVLASALVGLPACDGGDPATGGAGGGGGSQGGGGSGTGGTGGTGGSAFTCADYCAAIDTINASLGCNAFDCSMTCPAALDNFETQGCSKEGIAAFGCILGTPESSWVCDAAGDLSYNGAECGTEVTALTDCQTM